MTIHDDAWDGSLSRSKLKEYLDVDRGLLEQLDPQKGITPLAAATVRGHVTVVESLLKADANPDTRCKNGQTALGFAASRTTKNRPRIIQLLLSKMADPDATCPYLNNNTPVMLLILHSRDIDAITELMKYTPSLTVENINHDTAVTLAEKSKDQRVIYAVSPPAKKKSNFAAWVDRIVNVAVFILGWVDNPRISGAVKGVVQRLYDIQLFVDQEMNKEINVKEPETMQDFENNIIEYIDKKDLDRFFKPNNPLLKNIAKKAARLKDDVDNPLSDPKLLPKAIALAMYKHVIYCDDSGSMKTGSRFEDMKEIVDLITQVSTPLMPDDKGVDMCFINSNGDGMELSNLREAGVRAVMDKVGRGINDSDMTEIGYNLERRILQPLVYDVLDGGDELAQPILVSVLTDGAPKGHNEEGHTFVTAVSRCGDFLADNVNPYPRTAVKFQVSQIGTSGDATKFLDYLNNETRITEVLNCSTDRLDEKYKHFDHSKQELVEWLLTTLTENITGRRSDA